MKWEQNKHAFVPDYTEHEHWYLHKESGIRVPSVTTISSVIKKPWLEKWKLKEGINYLIENYGQSLTHKQYDIALESAMTASEVKSEQALIIGSAVHNTIEQYLDDWLLKGEKPEKQLIHYYANKFVQDECTHLRYDITETQVIAALRSAQELFEQFPDFEPVAVELCVGSVKYKYAGMLDLLCRVGGKLEIWDWKTTVMIDPKASDYPIQINAYRKAYETMSGETIHKQKIIQLSKSENKFTMYEVAKSNTLLQAFYSLADYYEKVIQNNDEYYKEVRKHDQ